MGTKDKQPTSKEPGKVDKTFDDLEDAFFATGDSTGFWEPGEGPPGQEEGGPPDSGGASDNGSGAIAVKIPAPPAPVTSTEPAEVADESDESGSAPDVPDEDAEEGPVGAGDGDYDPTAFHADPGEIEDHPTEVWSKGDAESVDEGLALLDVPTVVPEAGQMAAIPAPISDSTPETAPNQFEPLTDDNDWWQQASLSLERAASKAQGPGRAALLGASGSLQLLRSDGWEEAGRLLASAIENGLGAADTPKGYADVVANQGDFTRLRDLLVARGEALKGAAAVEAFQDAALVERNSLKDDAAAISLLERALEIREDWFTLRLLRELHYRSKAWTSIIDVLERMAGLCTGPRLARVQMERGRILEVEVQELDKAATAYSAARVANPHSIEAFLASARVAGLQSDWSTLAALYAEEGARTEGADAQFWYAKSARVARDGGLDSESVSDYYLKATENAGALDRTIHHEAQAVHAQAGQWEAFAGALAREAATLEGGPQALVLYRLGQVQEHQLNNIDASIASFKASIEADPSAGPAADAACRLLGAAGRISEALELLERWEGRVGGGVMAGALAFRMGEMCELLAKDPEAAIDHYGRALAKDPSHPFAGDCLARVAGRCGRWKEAVEALEATVNSGDHPAVTSRVWYRIGRIQEVQLNDTNSAAHAYGRAVENSVQQPGALDALVHVLEGADDPKALAAALMKCSTTLGSPQERTAASYRAARILVDQCADTQGATEALHRCLEDAPDCIPAVSLLRTLSAQNGAWQAVYDLRRLEAGAASNEDPAARRWHLLAAAEATYHLEGLDPQGVALEVLDDAPNDAGAIDLLETGALRARDTQRLLSVYRRIRAGSDDPVLKGRLDSRMADLAQDVGDDARTIRSISAVLDAGESAGEQALGALARLAITLERWGLAERALSVGGSPSQRARLLEASSDDHKAVAQAWRDILHDGPTDCEAAAGLERALGRQATRDGLAAAHGSLASHEADDSVRSMHALLAGHLYESDGDVDGAINFYARAFKADPYPGKAFDALIRLHGERVDSAAVQNTFGQLKQPPPLQHALALYGAGDASGAIALYQAEIEGLSKNVGAEMILPLVIHLEHALERSGAWDQLFEALGLRLAHTADTADVALIESKRRWILAERMADTDTAWDFYRKLHEEQPEDPDVLEALARIAGARGESKLAIQFLDGLSNIASSADHAARYQRRIAEVHMAAEDHSQAREAFLRALDHSPNDVESLGGLKTIAEAGEDWHGLVGVLTRELQLLQDDEQTRCCREIALLWEERIADPAVATDSWRQVLELVPGDAEALSHLVGLAKAQEAWASYIDHGRALVHYLEGEERTGLLASMGQAAYERLNREEDAIRFLDEASVAVPPSLDAARILERIHTSRGSWDLVVEAVTRQAHASEEGEGVTLFLKAARIRLESLRDKRGAAALYEETLTHAPDNLEALKFLGAYLYDTDELEKAVEIFERLESIDQERDLDDFDVQMETAMYYFRFGEAQRKLERVDEATKRYEQALELNQSHLPSLEAVAPLYVSGERWADAHKVLRQVLQLTGGQGDSQRLGRVYGNLGIVEYRQGNTDKAIQRFNKALELSPTDVHALRGYAEILYERKDWNNLLNAYNNIIYHAKERDEFIQAYLMKGFVLDSQMELADKAGQHYEKSLTFDPTHANALLRLSELAMRKEDWDKSLSFASRALGVPTGVEDGPTRGHLHLAIAIGRSVAGDLSSRDESLAAAGMSDAELGEIIKNAKPEPAVLHALLKDRLQSAL